MNNPDQSNLNLAFSPSGIDAPRQPVVFSRDGEVFANSRDIADAFDKEHRNVIASIDNLLKSLAAEKSAAGNRAFLLAPFTDPTQPGREFRSFDMTRDGFTLLVMGFTGTRALKWKLRYIEAFNAMEAELRNRPAVDPMQMVDCSDPRVILGVIGHLQTEVAQKDEVIAEQGNRLKKLDRLEGAKGSMCISDAAKTLGLKRDYLFNLMAARRWIFKRPGNKNWLAYDDKRKASLLEHDDHLYMDNEGRERVATRVLVTAKGLVKLAELLEQPLH
jgi:Rha family phage regulatory protein